VWGGGTPTMQDTWSDVWGDGVVRMVMFPGYWDDGNMFGNDGCDGSCQTETGFICTQTIGAISTWQPIWGDGIHVNGEQWDDGNSIDNDGWSSSCNVEPGWSCTGGTPTTPDTWGDLCGDGTLIKTMESDYWDDGNTSGGDGCSSTWKVEDGWKWESTIGAISICQKLPGENIFDKGFQAQALAVAAMAGTAIASSANMSTPNGMWQSMNIMQLFMLILLLGVYLPKRVKNLLLANSFLSSSFKIPFIEHFYAVKNILGYFDFSQENPYLHSIGIESGSTFNNTFSQFLALTSIIFLHLALIPLRNWGPKKEGSRCANLMRKAGRFIWKLLTFSIYLRLMMQCSQFLLITTISEFYTFNLENSSRILSLWFASIVATSLLLFFIFGVYLWMQRIHDDNEGSSSKFAEMFNGLKTNKYCMSFNLIHILRRTIFIVWIIWFQWIQRSYFLIGVSVIQILYVSVVIAIRPFNRVKDNIIEITNELVFFMLLFGLNIFKDKEKWDEISRNVYGYLIMFPSMFILAISVCKWNIILLHNFFQVNCS
jgi:cysteine-rich repeat protein